MENKGSTVYFRNLDILRMISAFLVVFAHGFEGWFSWFGYPKALASSDNAYNPNEMGTRIKLLFSNMSIGVEVFFVISGFLITYLLIVEKENFGKINIFNFYVRRTLRIWPLYFLIIALSPFWVSYLGSVKPDYLWNILFLNNFHAIQTEQWQFPFAHYWSICVEEHFYLVWPLLIAFIPVKRLPQLFSVIIFASICFRVYAYFYLDHKALQYYLNTFSRMDALAIGAFLAYAHYKKPIVINISRLTRCLIFVTFLFCFFIDHYIDYPDLFAVMVKKYIYLAFICFVFCNYLFNPDVSFNFKKKNVLHYLGKISFGIYMYHNVLIDFVNKKIIIPNNQYHLWLYSVLYIGLTILLAVISYECIEKPLLKLKNRFAVVKTTR